MTMTGAAGTSLSRGARMSTVLIPAVLRPNVGGAKCWSSTAARSGRSSTRSSSGTRRWAAELLTDEGELNRFVNVYVNGQDVRYLEGLDTPVTAADEVRLLPAMAGG